MPVKHAPLILSLWVGLCGLALGHPPPKIPIAQIPADMPPAVRAAVEKLYSRDDEDVLEGISALSSMGEDAASAAPFLASMLDTKHPRGPNQATWALMKIGKAAIEPSILTLQLGDNYARRRAADVLVFYKDERAIDPLITSVDDFGYGTAPALQRFGQAAMDRLLAGLSDKEPTVRARSARVLGAMGAGQAEEALAKAIGDTDAEVRLGALSSLARLHAAPARPDPAVAKAAMTVLGDPDAKVRRLAIKIIAGQNDAKYLDVMSEAVGDGDAEVRLMAADAIGKMRDERAMAVLLAMLKSSDGAVRHAAVGFLARSGDKRAVEALRDRLKDTEPLVRERTVAALSSLLKGADAFDALAETMRDRESVVRRAAIIALAASGDARAAGAIATALNDADEGLRLEAARQLAQFGKPGTEGLLKALGNDQPSVRASAIAALAERAEPPLDKLGAALGDADGRVRAVALEALAKHNALPDAATLRSLALDFNISVRVIAVSALGKLKDAASVEAFVANLDAEPRLADAAVEALVRVGSAAVPALAKSVRSETARVRRGARAALDRIDDPSAKKALAEAPPEPAPVAPVKPPLPPATRPVRNPALVWVDGSTQPRAVALPQVAARIEASAVTSPQILAKALRQSPDAAHYGEAATRLGEPAARALADLLKDQNEDVRFAAVCILGRMDAAVSVRPLVAAMSSDDAEVRRKAMDSLRRINQSEALAAVAAAQRDADAGVREEALRAVADKGGATSLTAALEALRDADRHVRQTGLEYLANWRRPETLEAVCGMLADPDWHVRRTAAAALGGFGDKRGVESLLRALDDAHWYVSQEAISSLRQITKQQIDDPAAWREWWGRQETGRK